MLPAVEYLKRSFAYPLLSQVQAVQPVSGGSYANDLDNTKYYIILPKGL